MFKKWKHDLDKEFKHSHMAGVWDGDGKWEEDGETAQVQHLQQVHDKNR